MRELAQALDSEEPGHGNWCLTLELPEDDSIWVQVLEGTLNLAYPRTASPAVLLAAVIAGAPTNFTLVEWERGRWATFEFGECGLTELAGLIDRVFSATHEVRPDYEPDVTVERV